LAALAGAVVLISAGTVYAQLSGADAVSARISGYRETGAAFKTLNDQLKSDAPLKIMVEASVRQIVQTTHDQYLWFPAGSGPESGAKTHAKPEIWTDAADFKIAQDNFQKQAALMSQAVDSGDTMQMTTQARALGAACAACHSKFRERE
jgi:cytochrome c556